MRHNDFQARTRVPCLQNGCWATFSASEVRRVLSVFFFFYKKSKQSTDVAILWQNVGTYLTKSHNFCDFFVNFWFFKIEILWHKLAFCRTAKFTILQQKSAVEDIKLQIYVKRLQFCNFCNILREKVQMWCCETRDFRTKILQKLQFYNKILRIFVIKLQFCWMQHPDAWKFR